MRILILLSCAAALGFFASGCRTARAINPFAGDEAGYPYVIEVPLQQVNGSSVEGTAYLVHQPGDVTVLLVTKGLDEQVRHTGHFHRGRCGEEVREIDAIAPFQILETRGAQAVTTFDSDEFQPNESYYMLHIHVADGRLVACGDVPQHPHGE